MPDKLVEVGADEVVQFLRAASDEIAKEVSAVVRSAAKRGAEAARAKASEQGFDPPGRSGRGSGELVRRIGSAAKGTTAFIRESASRDGFDYPRVYEFGHGGDRAFMRPAAEEIAPEVVAEIEAGVRAAIERLAG